MFSPSLREAAWKVSDARIMASRHILEQESWKLTEFLGLLGSSTICRTFFYI
jgi:hypothetical protein